MKLIIDIPDNVYEMVMNTGTFGIYRFNTAKAIKNGIPLDDVKAEIQAKYDSIPWRYIQYDDGWIDALEWVLYILDNIDKAESEDKG